MVEISDHYSRVAKFMVGAGQTVLLKPTMPNEFTRRLRVKLLLEELQEFVSASGFKLELPADGSNLKVDLRDLSIVPDAKPDLVDMADGLADLSVVTTGAMVSCGIADEHLLREVDENNLAKVKNGTIDPDTGKLIKPPNHPKPNIDRVLREQGWKGK